VRSARERERLALEASCKLLAAYADELRDDLAALEVAALRVGAALDTTKPRRSLALVERQATQYGDRGPDAIVRRYRAPLAREVLRLHRGGMTAIAIAALLGELRPGIAIDRRRVGELIRDASEPSASAVMMAGRLATKTTGTMRNRLPFELGLALRDSRELDGNVSAPSSPNPKLAART